jgi:hypothetical protein
MSQTSEMSQDGAVRVAAVDCGTNSPTWTGGRAT